MNSTTRVVLLKPNSHPVTGDFVDIDVINGNMDKIDSVISFTVCTSTARPAVPFTGQAILETDTAKTYVWGGSAWLPLLSGLTLQLDKLGIGTAADANILRKLKLFSGGTNGTLSQMLLEQSGPAAGSRALSLKAAGEANERWWIDFDGKMQWGPGSAGGDVTLYRGGADTLGTDDFVQITRATTGAWCLGAKVSGESQPRAVLTSDGILAFGPGSSAFDVFFQRNGVGNLLVDGTLNLNQALNAMPAVSAGSKVFNFNHGYALYVDNAGAGGNNTRVWLDGPDGGEIVIGPRSGSSNFGSIRLRTDKTTASAANAFLDAGNVLYKSTSSARYKVKIRTEDFDHAKLMELRPVRFKDKAQFAELAEEAPDHVGLIAEEVHELGLTEYVHYDAEGRPNGVQYDRLTLGLLSIVKDLAARVERLENAASL